MEKRIKSYSSAAAFPDDDPSHPVAWILQYQNRMLGPLYTMESHRRKGLGLAVMAYLCQKLLEEAPDIPLYCGILLDEAISTSLVEKLGFVRSPSLTCILDIEVL